MSHWPGFSAPRWSKRWVSAFEDTPFEDTPVLTGAPVICPRRFGHESQEFRSWAEAACDAHGALDTFWVPCAPNPEVRKGSLCDSANLA